MMKGRKKESRMTRGGRNLVIMGMMSIVIACATTGVSLAIYHNTGDIYLDRSRPGYLPDEEEIEQENNEEEKEYVFEKNGKLTVEILEEYLEKLQHVVNGIDEYEKPFDEDLLSNERLGIPVDDNHDLENEGVEGS